MDASCWSPEVINAVGRALVGLAIGVACIVAVWKGMS